MIFWNYPPFRMFYMFKLLNRGPFFATINQNVAEAPFHPKSIWRIFLLFPFGFEVTPLFLSMLKNPVQLTFCKRHGSRFHHFTACFSFNSFFFLSVRSFSAAHWKLLSLMVEKPFQFNQSHNFSSVSIFWLVLYASDSDIRHFLVSADMQFGFGHKWIQRSTYAAY